MKTSKPNIAIVILAANKTAGIKKTTQSLPWGNSTLLGHTIKEIVKVQISNLYVVLGTEYESVFERHKHFPVKFIPNIEFETGEQSSIQQAIHEISELPLDGVLFLRANQPELDHLHLKEMLHSFTRMSRSIVATKHSYGLDLPCVFDSSYFQNLEELKNSTQGIELLIQQNLERTFKVTPERSFHTIETWEGYLKVHSDWFGEINPS